GRCARSIRATPPFETLRLSIGASEAKTVPYSTTVIEGGRAIARCGGSESQTGVTEQDEAERRVAADAVRSLFGGVRHLANGVSAEVSQLLGFHVAPRQLDRIEVWRMAGQALRTPPSALSVEPPACVGCDAMGVHPGSG